VARLKARFMIKFKTQFRIDCRHASFIVLAMVFVKSFFVLFLYFRYGLKGCTRLEAFAIYVFGSLKKTLV
jgi:hypothetical protein